MNSRMGSNTASDQNLGSVLCRAGCGFYGSEAKEGMCSKCYKETAKDRSDTDTGSGIVASPAMVNTSSTQTKQEISIKTPPISSQEFEHQLNTEIEKNTQDKKNIVSQEEQIDKLTPNQETSENQLCQADKTLENDEKAENNKKKKNRCFTCKKKTGLTGFECRCGNNYCSLHRYSDVHQCEFDYKEHGAQLIKKANPVIKADKINKL